MLFMFTSKFNDVSGFFSQIRSNNFMVKRASKAKKNDGIVHAPVDYVNTISLIKWAL